MSKSRPTEQEVNKWNSKFFRLTDILWAMIWNRDKKQPATITVRVDSHEAGIILMGELKNFPGVEMVYMEPNGSQERTSG